MATSTPMMTTTTSSSMRVKPSSAFLLRSRLMTSCIAGASMHPGWGGGQVPGSGARVAGGSPAGCCSGASVALDVLVDREHRKVKTDHHSADHGTHDEHHDRFDRGGQGLGGAVDFPVIEIGNLVEHLTDLTAFFADFDHLRDHRGEDLVVAHGRGHRLAVADG